MKTDFEILIFFDDGKALFPAVPLAVLSVLNRRNTEDAAVTLPIAYHRAGYHCGDAADTADEKKINLSSGNMTLSTLFSSHWKPSPCCR